MMPMSSLALGAAVLVHHVVLLAMLRLLQPESSRSTSPTLWMLWGVSTLCAGATFWYQHVAAAAAADGAFATTAMWTRTSYAASWVLLWGCVLHSSPRGLSVLCFLISLVAAWYTATTSIRSSS